jgi:hypothetical protein
MKKRHGVHNMNKRFGFVDLPVINKKAQFNMMHDWAELMFFVLFVIGFGIILFAKNAFFTYLFIFIGGVMTGRFLFQKRDKYPIPFYLLVSGFVFGFVLAIIITNKANWKVSILLYVVANMLSFYIHEKGYLTWD